MIRKKLGAAVLARALLLSGCGDADTLIERGNISAEEAVADRVGVMDYGVGSGVPARKMSMEQETPTLPTANENQQTRKWVATFHISAETENLPAAVEEVNKEITELEGYVENQRSYNGSNYPEFSSYGSATQHRSQSMTVRIPEDSADAFCDSVEGITNVVSREKSLEDITLNYVDTESRKKMLETEESRLMEMMGEAEEISDLLQIESRLSEVRYQLDSAVSQLRVYDNQVNYSTIYLNIEEVKEFTQTEEPGIWERITAGMSKNFSNMKKIIGTIFVHLITWFPYYIVIVPAAGIAVYGTKKFKKWKKNRKNGQQEHTDEQ